MTKVQKIRAELDSSKSDILPDEVACFSRPLISFRPTSAEEYTSDHDMTKTCDLYPLPARQHKQCLQAMVPVVTLIVNKSLAEGTVPNNLKEALVRPLIKKIVFRPLCVKELQTGIPAVQGDREGCCTVARWTSWLPGHAGTVSICL